MGDVCTRSCGFCAVKTGRPEALDPSEPARVAEGARRLGLRHVVITSVDRDDLPDGGAGHFSRTVLAIREASPGTVVEVLTPDFQGDLGAVATVLSARPEIFNHNVETVPRLQRRVRPRGDFGRSLRILRRVKEISPETWTKSGLMVGLGESPDEVDETLRAMRAASVDMVTIGQYLQPTRRQLAVHEFIDAAQFDHHAAVARGLGFASVFSGPFVRSSYLADQAVPA
jgi:lipoic acid synthetase